MLSTKYIGMDVAPHLPAMRRQRQTVIAGGCGRVAVRCGFSF